MEYHAQAAVNSVFELIDRYEINWKDIERIENETYEAGMSIIAGDETKWAPKTRETADHSMPYCIARAFIDHEMTIDQFSPRKIEAEDVKRLMERIEVQENGSFTDRYGDSFPHRMIVHTENKTYEWTVEFPKGHHENPLTRKELEDKFKTAAARFLAEAEAEAVLERIWEIKAEEDVSRFLSSI